MTFKACAEKFNGENLFKDNENKKMNVNLIKDMEYVNKINEELKPILVYSEKFEELNKYFEEKLKKQKYMYEENQRVERIYKINIELKKENNELKQKVNGNGKNYLTLEEENEIIKNLKNEVLVNIREKNELEDRLKNVDSYIKTVLIGHIKYLEQLYSLYSKGIENKAKLEEFISQFIGKVKCLLENFYISNELKGMDEYEAGEKNNVEEESKIEYLNSLKEDIKSYEKEKEIEKENNSDYEILDKEARASLKESVEGISKSLYEENISKSQYEENNDRLVNDFIDSYISAYDVYLETILKDVEIRLNEIYTHNKKYFLEYENLKKILTKENEKLQKEYREIQKFNQESEDDYYTVNSTNKILTEKLKDKNRELQNLKEQNKKEVDEHNELKKKYINLESEYKKLEEINKKYVKKEKDAEEFVNSKRRNSYNTGDFYENNLIIKELTKQNEDLKTKLKDNKGENDVLYERNKELEDLNITQNLNIEDLKKENEKLNKMNEKYEKDYNSLNNSYHSLNDSFEKYKNEANTQIIEKNKKMKLLELRYNTMRKVKDRLEALNEKMKKSKNMDDKNESSDIKNTPKEQIIYKKVDILKKEDANHIQNRGSNGGMMKNKCISTTKFISDDKENKDKSPLESSLLKIKENDKNTEIKKVEDIRRGGGMMKNKRISTMKFISDDKENKDKSPLESSLLKIKENDKNIEIKKVEDIRRVGGMMKNKRISAMKFISDDKENKDKSLELSLSTIKGSDSEESFDINLDEGSSNINSVKTDEYNLMKKGESKIMNFERENLMKMIPIKKRNIFKQYKSPQKNKEGSNYDVCFVSKVNNRENLDYIDEFNVIDNELKNLRGKLNEAKNKEDQNGIKKDIEEMKQRIKDLELKRQLLEKKWQRKKIEISTRNPNQKNYFLIRENKFNKLQKEEQNLIKNFIEEIVVFLKNKVSTNNNYRMDYIIKQNSVLEKKIKDLIDGLNKTRKNIREDKIIEELDEYWKKRCSINEYREQIRIDSIIIEALAEYILDEDTTKEGNKLPSYFKERMKQYEQNKESGK